VFRSPINVSISGRTIFETQRGLREIKKEREGRKKEYRVFLAVSAILVDASLRINDR